MAAFGRSISRAKKTPAKANPAHDFSVKSVPRKGRNATNGDEVCAKKPEALGIEDDQISILEEGAAEIRLGDVEKQLKELEVSSLTSEVSFGESTAGSDKTAAEGQNLSSASSAGKGSSSMSCLKNVISVILTVLATIATLVLAIYVKVTLEGLDLGPFPT
ncbi:uncharacterized protein LOC112343121 [Selaginella moellendorffii]|uniref:uncharacterized protein LOC112343121 n=1 Tax=Selaginella moellendorffii TaxID=88036 RepID=UPI000D1C3BF2|nr:uncharacterized protein LOC112343121 [Selaginella moellendorffii]|eukprot:XP_024521856.1 uncharacterized protein LOC112343121 [Selaginella moellendorffii]